MSEENASSKPRASTKVKRLSAEFVGDQAIEIELLEVSLRSGEEGRSKLEKDTALVGLALRALEHTIDEYRAKTGIRFPSRHEIEQHLSGGHRR